jgi:hypothetical protein
MENGQNQAEFKIPNLKRAQDLLREWEVGDQHPDWLLRKLICLWGVRSQIGECYLSEQTQPHDKDA